MVEEKHIAWHAGKSKWKKFTNLNYNSIGIELVNRGHQHGYEKFTNFQKIIIERIARRLTPTKQLWVACFRLPDSCQGRPLAVQVWLLRGNHEDECMNKRYGLRPNHCTSQKYSKRLINCTPPLIDRTILPSDSLPDAHTHTRNARLAVNTVRMFANVCSRSQFANTVRNRTRCEHAEGTLLH